MKTNRYLSVSGLCDATLLRKRFPEWLRRFPPSPVKGEGFSFSTSLSTLVIIFFFNHSHLEGGCGVSPRARCAALTSAGVERVRVLIGRLCVFGEILSSSFVHSLRRSVFLLSSCKRLCIFGCRPLSDGNLETLPSHPVGYLFAFLAASFGPQKFVLQKQGNNIECWWGHRAVGPATRRTCQAVPPSWKRARRSLHLSDAHSPCEPAGPRRGTGPGTAKTCFH